MKDTLDTAVIVFLVLVVFPILAVFWLKWLETLVKWLFKL